MSGRAASLEAVLAALEGIAPLALAESWDNVGLLLPPADPARPIGRVFFAIDLTEPVLEEAIACGADLVVAYHPPLFEGKKRFSAARAADRVIVGALRRGVPVFSPHTSLDVAADGITDWLARGVGEGKVAPLVPHASVPGAGVGRTVVLAEEASIEEVVRRLKAHLGVAGLRLARAGERKVRTAVVCAGAGGAVFEKAGRVDLLVTGEMRHHDVLARVGEGTHVVLAEHSSSERGFLAVYAGRVAERVGVEVVVSGMDREALERV